MAYRKYKLGDLVEQYDEINLSGEFADIDDLQGINSNKYFQECKSNKNDIDLYRYRICRHGMFSYNRATSRNGEKISIALRTGGDCIVSPSYYCFRVKDEEVLCPEYLDIWFKRPVFDRYARFNSWGSATEFFTFDDFCATEIMLPPISEQRKIVHDYQVITNRIELLRKIIVNTDSQMRDFAKVWVQNNSGEESKLSDCCSMEYGYTESAVSDDVGPKFLRITDISDILVDWNTVPYCPISDKDFEKYKLQQGDVVVARTGATSGAATMIWKKAPDAVFASFLVRIKANDKDYQPFISLAVTSADFYGFVQANAMAAGSAQPQANPPLLGQYMVSLPSKESVSHFNEKVSVFLDYIENCSIEISKLRKMQDLFLVKVGISKL